MKTSTWYRKRLSQPWLLAVLALLGLLLVGIVQAQPVDPDPPDRVGRIAEVFGPAWLWSPDTGEWIEAVRNRPVTSGDRLATDRGARIELDVGSTTLRLDADTELEVLQLDDTQVVLQLHEGSVAARVRDAAAVGEFELETDEGRMRVQSAGRYRFDRRDGSTHLTVYAGQAYFEGPGSALTLIAGQRGQFWIQPGGSAQYSITDPIDDAFAAWNAGRDRDEDRLAASARYVSPEMTGARELDRWGRWEQSPEYGPIWFPRGVPSGWAPYSTGHWAWIAPWGWTWVDEAPWGFAPFHYGRWVYYRSAWCWTPGAFVRRPVYAPALVAWIGGPRASVSVTIGGGPAVGWFPLGPREVYVPAYRTSPRYVRQLNINHVPNVAVIDRVVRNPDPTHRDFVNRRLPRAVTIVPERVLVHREPVAPHAVRGGAVRPAVATLPAATLLAPPVGAPPRVRDDDGSRRPGGPAFAARPGRQTPRAAEDPMRRIPERIAPPAGNRAASDDRPLRAQPPAVMARPPVAAVDEGRRGSPRDRGGFEGGRPPGDAGAPAMRAQPTRPQFQPPRQPEQQTQPAQPPQPEQRARPEQRAQPEQRAEPQQRTRPEQRIQPQQRGREEPQPRPASPRAADAPVRPPIAAPSPPRPAIAPQPQQLPARPAPAVQPIAPRPAQAAPQPPGQRAEPPGRERREVPAARAPVQQEGGGVRGAVPSRSPGGITPP